MRRHGKTFQVVAPQVVSKAQAAESVTGLWRFVFPRLPFEQAVLLRRT